MSSEETKSDRKLAKKDKHKKEEETRGKKRRSEPDKSEKVEVQSANNWGNVELGGDERKNKFLRLMGASKKEHHGRFVIGERSGEHGRSKEDNEKLAEDLEDQYQQGMGLKLSGAARRHKGLGFQETNDSEPALVPENEPTQPQNSQECFGDEEKTQSSKKSKNGKKDSSDLSAEKSNDGAEKRKSKPMLGFVKSSS